MHTTLGHRRSCRAGAPPRRVSAAFAAVIITLVAGRAFAQPQAAPTLETAQYRFYDGRYEESAELAAALLAVDADRLAAIELRTAALLFEVKRLIGEPDDRDRALKACVSCPDLIAAFLQDVDRGRALATARLEVDPADREAQFFLGKLDLNFIWLHLGPLGRRTGWSEYREARRTLDALLEAEPTHVRARVARAWIDYIVDTRVSWMFRWVLGGGDRTGALANVREAAVAPADFYARVEARFALWEMLAREGLMGEAVDVARGLVADFPGNRELQRFVGEHAAAAGPPGRGQP